MKNIRPYKKDNYDFHLQNYKFHEEKLKANGIDDSVIKNSDIEKSFRNYENLAESGLLGNLAKNISLIPENNRENYISILYDNKSLPSNLFFEFKSSLQTVDGQSVVICPFCEHNTSKTLDHIVAKRGKNPFPEFCDMPLNLIPMCNDCNQHKGSTWVDKNNNTTLLNLYYDTIPSERFLFVDINITTSNILELSFKILVSNITDKTFGNKLKYTFEKLKILDMYNEVGKQEITEIQKYIKKYKPIKSKDDIKCTILFETEDDNNYKNVLKRECANNSTVFDFLYC